MLKRLFELLPSALTAISFFLIGRYVVTEDLGFTETVYLAVPASVVLLAVGVSSSYLQDILFGRSVWPEMLAELREILMSAVRNGYSKSTSATIEEWAALEDKLGNGAVVYTMTHDLYLYDCAKPAYETTARNLREGVRYVYFLDRTVSDSAANELYTLILNYLTSGGSQNVAGVEKLLSRNLVVRKLYYPLLYPFSIVKLPGEWAAAHWYTSEPTNASDTAGGNSLVVLTITNRDHGDMLLRIFKKLARPYRSRKLKCRRSWTLPNNTDRPTTDHLDQDFSRKDFLR